MVFSCPIDADRRSMQTFGAPHPVGDIFQERIKRRAILGGLLSEYEGTA